MDQVSGDEATLRAPRSPHASPFAPGAVVAGSYVLGALLGEGTFGWVFAAERRGDGVRAAIKVLKAEHATDESTFTRFKRRELELLRRVHEPERCPFVVGVLEPDILMHDGFALLVLELVEGPTLHELLARERFLDESEARSLAADVAAGLARIHAAGGVHRDLKPENVRVRRGRPVILDLGIAKAMWETQTLTASGQGLMTPYYASPEQLSGGDVGPHTDVYSLGLILFEMLTGVVPLAGRSLVETIAARTTREPPDPRAASGRPISEATSRLVLRCLSREPSSRPTTSEIATALSGGARVASHSELALARTERAPPRRGRGVGALLAGTAALAALGAAAWIATRDSSGGGPQPTRVPSDATASARVAPSSSPAAAPSVGAVDLPSLVVRAPATVRSGAALELELVASVGGPVVVYSVSRSGEGVVLVPNRIRSVAEVRPDVPLRYPSDAERREVGAAASLPAGAHTTTEWLVAIVNPRSVPRGATTALAMPFTGGSLVRPPDPPTAGTWRPGDAGTCDLEGRSCSGVVRAFTALPSSERVVDDVARLVAVHTYTIVKP